MDSSREHADALSRASAVQRSAASLGFDWPEVTGVFEKIHEEIDEIHQARDAGDHEHAKDELGDLLFAVVNLSRFLLADPAAALHRATDRFERRFQRVCEIVRGEGREPQDCTLQQLDAAWERAKKELHAL